MTTLISIMDAARDGIERLRLPRWADSMDHIKIDIINKVPGPWVNLYCPANVAISGRDPIKTLITMLAPFGPDWEPYTGPLPESDEYKKASARMAPNANPPKFEGIGP